MKIHFCDICNESVPQNQLDQGFAVVRKGRVVCSACERAMGGAADETQSDLSSATQVGPASAAAKTLTPDSGATQIEGRSSVPAAYPRESGGGLVAGFLAAVSIVLVAVVAVMLIDRIDADGDQFDSELGNLRREMVTVESKLVGQINGVQGAYLSASGSLTSEVSSLKEQRAEDNRLLRAQLDENKRDLDDLRERMGAMGLTEREVADHARSIAALNAAIAAIDLDIGQLAQAIADRPPVIIAAPVAEPMGPSWLALLEDLGSDNSGVRWNAVEDLGHTSDVGVVPYLIPVLDDEDTFVRMAAARILGGLGSDESVGPLIEALGDTAPSVRDAAVVSLRLLTGQNFRFNPQGKDSDRAKRIRAWQDWHADQLEDQEAEQVGDMAG